MDNFSLITVQNQLLAEQAACEIRACNSVSEKYGLSLTEDQITELVECRKDALKKTGRVEFGGGILPKLIYAFCDSEYIDEENYESTLAELQEAFYYLKNEFRDTYSDDELIEYMVEKFNGTAHGQVGDLL
jgi:hypothetical protein